MASPLVIIANRGPLRTTGSGSRKRVQKAAGGLVTALDPVLHQRGGIWISAQETDHATLVEAAREELSYELGQVEIPKRTQQGFYRGVSNGVFWPLLHSLPPTVTLADAPWDDYVDANQRFAAQTDALAPDDGILWVHDYHLMLVPKLLRERRPKARIGWFCHVPWSGPDLFGAFPRRVAILEGLLGANLLAFHTRSYADNFLACVRELTPHAVDEARLTVKVGRRTVRLAVLPIGVPWSEIQTLATDPRVLERAEKIRAAVGNRQLVLGVDRLDYTKGIPERIRAFERLLVKERAIRSKVLFVQVMVPSREAVQAYRDLKDEVDRLVGDINGRFSVTGRVPIHYYYRNLSPQELYAHYRVADVGLVTPLRDGMNLVAQEYVASRVDGDGALVLSEFAGSARVLEDALQVNPHDVDATTAALKQALKMPLEEQRERMRSLRTVVKKLDVHLWAQEFLELLERRR